MTCAKAASDACRETVHTDSMSRPHEYNTSVSPSLVQVLQQIEEQKINIYQFPDTDYDEEEMAANKRLKVRRGAGG